MISYENPNYMIEKYTMNLIEKPSGNCLCCMPIKYENENIYCRYFNCCPTCFELTCKKKVCMDTSIFLCCCLTIIFE